MTQTENLAAAPVVSIVMSAYRSSRTIRAAIESVTRQTLSQLELIVVDDASDDDTCDIVRAVAQSDPRVRLIASPVNRGPAATRNIAIDAARGDWIGIVDSDDLIHPYRLARMLAAARDHGVDIISDDMVPFGTKPGIAGETTFAVISGGTSRRIDAVDFVRSDLSRSLGSLGYCKPLIRRAALGTIRYDTEVGIGEDFDFCLRLLMAGLTFLLWPEPTYLYRRHEASLSHRLSVDHLERQIAAHDKLTGQAPPDTSDELAPVMAERRRLLVRSLAYERLVAAIKGRHPATALAQLLRRPALFADLAQSSRERWNRQRTLMSPAGTETIRVRLIADGIPEPVDDGAIVLAVPPVPTEGAATHHSDVAIRLAALYATGPLDVVVSGFDALYGLGYLPGAHRITVELLPGEDLSDTAFWPLIDAVFGSAVR